MDPDSGATGKKGDDVGTDGRAASTVTDSRGRGWVVKTEPLSVALQAGLAGLLIVLSLPMPQGSLAQPGAGFWPMWLGFALAVLAVVSGVQWFMRRRVAEPERLCLKELLVPSAAIASLVAYLLLLGAVGFTLPSIVLICGWLKAFGKETWRLSLLLSTLGSLALALLFDRLLGVPLPDDLLLSWFLT